MKYKIDKEEEEDFNEWMESISFVDNNDNVLPVILTKDQDPNPGD